MQSAKKEKTNLIKLVLLVSFLLMGVKFFAWHITNSNAILTDAMESIVNVLTGSFALFSLYYAAKPKDDDHPYGHGKIEQLSAGFEGGMILLAGLAMIIKGITAFFHKDQVKEIDWGIYLTVFAGGVNFIFGKYLQYKGRTKNSPTLFAEGKHLMSDAVSSIGIIIGLGLVYFTNIMWIDYAVSILLGIYIMSEGIKVLRTSVDDLLDKADLERIEHLIELLNKNRREKWIDIHNLRVLKYGDTLHVDCHMTLPWYDSLEDSHAQVSLVENLIRTDADREVEFFIHSDPCVPPQSCTVCQISSCAVRKHAFIKRLEWNVKNLLPNEKHNVS